MSVLYISVFSNFFSKDWVPSVFEAIMTVLSLWKCQTDTLTETFRKQITILIC